MAASAPVKVPCPFDDQCPGTLNGKLTLRTSTGPGGAKMVSVWVDTDSLVRKALAHFEEVHSEVRV